MAALIHAPRHAIVPGLGYHCTTGLPGAPHIKGDVGSADGNRDTITAGTFCYKKPTDEAATVLAVSQALRA